MWVEAGVVPTDTGRGAAKEAGEWRWKLPWLSAAKAPCPTFRPGSDGPIQCKQFVNVFWDLTHASKLAVLPPDLSTRGHTYTPLRSICNPHGPRSCKSYAWLMVFLDEGRAERVDVDTPCMI